MNRGIAAPLRRRLAVAGLALGAVLLLPAAANAACPDRPLAREFARWLDPIKYTQVPGGHFEGSTAGWTLSGGARVVSGNEPFYLRSDGDDKSLYLPSGSSATTPYVCVELLDLVARFVSRNRGSLLGALEVDALVRTSGGTVVLPAGVDAALSGWHPSCRSSRPRTSLGPESRERDGRGGIPVPPRRPLCRLADRRRLRRSLPEQVSGRNSPPRGDGRLAGREHTELMTNGIAAPLRRRLAVFALVIGAAVLLPGAGHAAGCADASEQEFLPWLDVAYYRLAPGGGFEGRNRAWKFTGGAEKQVVNEKFFLRSESDTKSLDLPAKSSATTPFFCVAPLDPTVRFVARNRGGLLSVLKVDVLLSTVAGDVTLPGGVVAGGKSWAPSPVVPLFANLLAPLSGDTAKVAVRFSTGGTSAWQIDDVYVDPFRSR